MVVHTNLSASSALLKITELINKIAFLNFMQRLPENLHYALLVIQNKEHEPLPKDDIRKLLLMRLITEHPEGGWRVNGNGREYLRWHKLVK